MLLPRMFYNVNFIVENPKTDIFSRELLLEEHFVTAIISRLLNVKSAQFYILR